MAVSTPADPTLTLLVVPLESGVPAGESTAITAPTPLPVNIVPKADVAPLPVTPRSADCAPGACGRKETVKVVLASGASVVAAGALTVKFAVGESAVARLVTVSGPRFFTANIVCVPLKTPIDPRLRLVPVDNGTPLG